jgi:hypothetical protein
MMLLQNARDRHNPMVVGFFQLPVQSVPITTKVVSLKPGRHREVYSIQHYVIKFVSDLRQVSGFLHQ